MKKGFLGMLVLGVILAGGGVSGAAPNVVEKKVEYTADGVLMKGCLAFDENIKGRRPGVLVVPEWWGVNDYACRRARMLAGLGYTALVVDMYGEGRQGMTPDEAGKLSSEVMKNLPVAKERFIKAMDFLKGQAVADPAQMAAIGYCFGGGVVLNMARQGLDLKGVVSFHGSLNAVEPARPGGVKAKILVLTGGNDKFVPAEQVEAFKKEMEAARADLRVISYPGALHSFTNPDATDLGKKFNLPLAYDTAADQKSWEEMQGFLQTIFKR
jgi:dienelactone hydrolase